MKISRCASYIRVPRAGFCLHGINATFDNLSAEAMPCGFVTAYVKTAIFTPCVLNFFINNTLRVPFAQCRVHLKSHTKEAFVLYTTQVGLTIRLYIAIIKLIYIKNIMIYAWLYRPASGR